ncbi:MULTISPECIES: nicotinate-nucleotide adenylyltransferase [Bacillales]|uniref:Probable nicotinate-nucleotide adenylyltransferase n=1 Tax=Lysinibacillus louembei TaxID=1470088 RepID=A0ABZ0RXF4_9BACI|nr:MULTISPECIES: nicotinate-nucleotide adenylyltransferase [Bacillales]MCT6923264.1 nicotinate-nucleotide adenylyltransferase [Metasolibacillus sp.]MCT6939431.1 nicotinate-nucleotide adenylyltransferase [Metasolibacillus sp.]WPK11618.1 nicotinate-nucleotide adenylyltransferase [Lysinibacillus louembei]
MKRVGILGGTFNPIHQGHLLMANEAFHALKLDEVRFMPNATPPHKEARHLATDEQRVHMLELAISDVPYFHIEKIELESGGISYTYNTMYALQEREPDAKFYFIIGGDMIDSLHKWYHIEELTQLVQFVGIKRPGTEAKTAYPVQVLETPEMNVSSTVIRQRCHDGGPLKYIVPEAVEAYIRKEGLYGA